MTDGDVWAGDFDPLDDPAEKRVLFGALDSFYQYRKTAHYTTTHLRRQAFYALPSNHWQLLAEPPFSYLDTLIAVDKAIDANGDIALAILSTGASAFNLSLTPPEPRPDGTKHSLDWRGSATSNDLDKARTIIRQLYRDWSAEGVVERDACYTPVLEDLDTAFPLANVDRGQINVLIPGAGLGRLVFDICRAGFKAEGNEISYHALLTSSFILNRTEPGQKWDLYPWALNFSNRISREDQLRCVKIPDVHAGTALDEVSRDGCPHASERLSMTAADFLVLYSKDGYRGMYDAVCTVFFIDTAPNPFRIIETIRHCLKKGGLWINLGPLLWHFESRAGAAFAGLGPDGVGRDDGREEDESGGRHGGDGGGNNNNAGIRRQMGMSEPGSVELTNEEVLLAVERSGFVVQKQEIRDVHSGYIQDPSSMLQYTYRLSHWVARKL